MLVPDRDLVPVWVHPICIIVVWTSDGEVGATIVRLPVRIFKVWNSHKNTRPTSHSCSSRIPRPSPSSMVGVLPIGTSRTAFREATGISRTFFGSCDSPFDFSMPFEMKWSTSSAAETGSLPFPIWSPGDPHHHESEVRVRHFCRERPCTERLLLIGRSSSIPRHVDLVHEVVPPCPTSIVVILVMRKISLTTMRNQARSGDTARLASPCAPACWSPWPGSGFGLRSGALGIGIWSKAVVRSTSNSFWLCRTSDWACCIFSTVLEKTLSKESERHPWDRYEDQLKTQTSWNTLYRPRL